MQTIQSKSQLNGEYLRVQNLNVQFSTDAGIVQAVNDISFEIAPGETMALVGESGSGKSVTSRTIMGLNRGGNARISGEIWLDGEELLAANEERLRQLRGNKMGMIFQDSLSGLHPFIRVGVQIREALMAHRNLSRAEAKKATIDMIDRVGLTNPEYRYKQYPHEFSGGMRQRAMIAMALICRPGLLIADEPTTALDVTVQASILNLIKELQHDTGTSVLLITHDLGVVAQSCDSVVVMYGGEGVEKSSVVDLFEKPEMPYTWGLLGSIPKIASDEERTALQSIPGQPPSLVLTERPIGCIFADRCEFKRFVNKDRNCETDRPEMRMSDSGHAFRCHLSEMQRSELRENLLVGGGDRA